MSLEPTTFDMGRAYRLVTDLGHGRFIARKPHLLTLVAGGDQLHLDLEGRLHRAWVAGASYQRGLDGRVRRVRIDRSTHGERWLEIDILPDGARERLLEHVQERVDEVGAALAAHPSPPGPALLEPLERAATRTTDDDADESERFDRVYDPIPILPPDQNRALVLQATSGCSWNRCTFCHLYRDIRFRAHPTDAFREHVRGVRDLVGAALPLRRGVFLGQANALCIEMHRLRAAIEVIREELGDAGRWPLGAFVDAFTRRRKRAELEELAALGLESVALGLESGSPRVLAALGKPAEQDEALRLVDDLGAAGIRRGVIVLAGAGGWRYAAEHVERTVSEIAAMRLGRRDRVYLSPLHVIGDSAYAARVEADDLGRLSRAEAATQARAIRRHLRAAGVEAAIALYDIRRFIY
jgi:radical SAM superfamily enzyme YgiQ (UPF0313 family)